MADQPTTATTFLILSDTHDFDFADNGVSSRPFQLPTAPVDVLLHCGDLTRIGGIDSFIKAQEMLKSIPAELKLVIAGNHDLELDQVFWSAQGVDEGGDEDPEDHDWAMYIMTGPRASQAGVLYLNEGTHSFTLKSGVRFSIHVSPYTPAFGDWAFGYPHNHDRFNPPASHVANNGGASSSSSFIAPHPIPDGVDIVMTHGAAKGILDWCPEGGHVGCEHLLQAIRRVKPKLHCFGHIHESNGVEIVDWRNHDGGKVLVERKNEALHRHFEDDEIENPFPRPFLWDNDDGERTLAVNAAIMNRKNRPENAPWVVKLDLPRSS